MSGYRVSTIPAFALAGASRSDSVPGGSRVESPLGGSRGGLAADVARRAVRAIDAATTFLVATALLVSAGCQSSDRVTGFGGASAPTASVARVWPAPPDRARIRYLGQIVGEESLNRTPSFGEAAQAVLAGPAPRVRFTKPVAADARGDRVYVADPSQPGGPCVHVLDFRARTHRAIREAGGKPLELPIDVAAGDGGVAVADSKRGAVYLFSDAGDFRGAIGAGQLQRPAAVAWHRDGRRLWVADAAQHAVFLFDSSGQATRRFGSRGSAAEQFNFPSGIAAGSAAPFEVAVADAMNFRVSLFDAGGAALRTIGKKGDAAGDFSLPRDVALDGDGHVYALDSQFENVQVFDGEGRLLLAFGQEGAGAGEFSVPSGIAIDEKNRILIADAFNQRVQVFQYLPETSP